MASAKVEVQKEAVDAVARCRVALGLEGAGIQVKKSGCGGVVEERVAGDDRNARADGGD